ncbi:MAG: tetratricopeptide repeat protein [Myxococcales bacterium]|nr:tetratricopeptide repeat protein [Myxococcales bacterium]
MSPSPTQPTGPHRPTVAALAVVALLATAWACGPKRAQLYDRDIGLSDSPLERSIAREPLRGALFDGWKALKKGELATATAHFQRHLKANPRSAAAHYHLGLIHMDERQFAKARVHLTKAGTLEPNLYGAWSNLGVLYMRNGEIAAATRALERGLAIAPTDARLLTNLGNAWLRRGRWASAMDAYERAGKLAGEHGTVRYNHALALAERHQYTEAQQLLDGVLGNRPGFVLARALRVACLQGQGKLAAAIAQGEKDLTLITPLPESHVVLGRAHLASGHLKKGLEAIEQAVELDSDNPIAVMTWAESLDAAGRRNEALTWYGRYLKLEDRRFEDARRIRRRVRALKKRG